MKTLSVAELRDWCKAKGFPLDGRNIPGPLGGLLRFEVPKEIERLAWFCNFMEVILRPRDQCVMWVTGWGIWESSENWHLYYRLRQAYGDSRLLEDAPGHLFLPYERADLATFIQIGLMNGWDLHLLPAGGQGRAFASHDGWVELEVGDAVERAKLRDEVSNVGLRLLS
jgi:hypothetical protein